MGSHTPPDEIRARLHYDPATGILTWKERPAADFKTCNLARAWNSQYAGKQAFTADNRRGYRVSFFSGVQLYAHRAAWVIVHGVWPSNQIDHINGDKSDNRLSNLREATALQNAWNAARRGGKGKFKGVRKYGEKWQARANWGGSRRVLGVYQEEEEAARAYDEFALAAHGEFARLNFPVA